MNLKRTKQSKKVSDRLDRYDQRKYTNKKRKRERENLDVGEKVLVLDERIKKKSAPGKFYKQTIQNISYFNKKTVFTIRHKQKMDKKTYYWIKNVENNKYLLKRFERSEIFVIVNKFVV